MEKEDINGFKNSALIKNKKGKSKDYSNFPKNAEFLLNFPRVILEFENAMQKFPVKKVLYKAIFQGKGLEFDSYRKFATDDDAGLIDWKASLRANELLAKKYVEERNLNVYFLVDVSSSMLFGSDKKLKAEYVAELVVALSHLVISSGDRIGLVMFSDSVVKMLHPSKSRNQFALFMKFLSDTSFYGGGFDLEPVMDNILSVIKSPYTVFILISDFIKTSKESERFLRLIGSRFETMAVMIRDPLDEYLPKTKYQFAVQDPYSNRQMILDPEIAAERYRENVIRQKNIIKNIFRKSQIDLLELNTRENFAIKVTSFLRARAMGGRI